MNDIVPKPWGYEYCSYEDKNIGIWHLIIKPHELTSMHCHPNKKTGLMVLDGSAKLSFLGDNNLLSKLDKRIIRQGVFHSTENIGNADLHLLEVESPNNKQDLLRLEDKYNRFGIPYEKERLSGTKDIDFEVSNVIDFHGSRLIMKTFKSHEDLMTIDVKKIIIIDGSIHRDTIQVAGAGDILDISIFDLLVSKFDIAFPFKVILVYEL